MLIQVPGMDMVDMVWDTVDTGVDTVDTTDVDTTDMDTHILTDTDTTWARDLLMLNPKQKLLPIQVPGMDMVDTDTDTDTTVERELQMLNQKRKLPLIQVPGTDMVATMATHTDMVDTMVVTHTDTEDTMAEDTTMDKS